MERVSCWRSCSAQSIWWMQRWSLSSQKSPDQADQPVSQGWFKDTSPGQGLLCEDDQLPFHGMQSWLENIKRWQHVTFLCVFFCQIHYFVCYSLGFISKMKASSSNIGTTCLLDLLSLLISFCCRGICILICLLPDELNSHVSFTCPTLPKAQTSKIFSRAGTITSCLWRCLAKGISGQYQTL